MMIVLGPDGELGNVLTLVTVAQPLTWLLQVMPLFFMVGGMVHARLLESAAREGGTAAGQYAAFARARAVRLLRPTAAFLLAWLVLGVVAHLTGLTAGPHARFVIGALVVVPQLLWFVGVYLGAAAFAPVMWRWHRRSPLAPLVVLVAAAVLVDAVRLAGGPGVVAQLNYAFVWLAVHQLGFWWRDGLLTRRVAVGMVTVGAAGLLLGVTVGPYPVSMVGLPGEEMSNMAPPSLALLAQATALVGVAALLRERAGRALQGPRIWAAVVAAGGIAMTAFLWHLSADLLAIAGFEFLGIDQPQVGGAVWWVTRPVWIALLALVTAGFVAVFARFDRGQPADRRPVVESRRWVDPAIAVSVSVVVLGVLMLATVGVDVLGNRPVFFLVADITPGFAVSLFALGSLGVAAVRPRRQSV